MQKKLAKSKNKNLQLSLPANAKSKKYKLKNKKKIVHPNQLEIQKKTVNRGRCLFFIVALIAVKSL